MCSKRNELNKQIIECRSQLSNVCPSVLLRSIHTKIQALNSKLFHHLEQTKRHKFENLTNPRNRTAPLENQNHHTVVTIPENLPLSNAEKSVLSKGLNFVPISKKSDEFTTRQDVEKFLRRVQLKAFFHNKEDKSDNTEKDAFETLTTKKSKWTLPEGQFASIDYFIKKCRHDVHKLKSNCNIKLSNLSKEEWTALINLKNRNDLVIKAETSVLSKGLNFVPISEKSDEFTTRQDVEKFLRRVQLKAFFHNKEDKSDNTEKNAFETVTTKTSKWTPPEGQFASIDYFIKNCRHDVHKLKSNYNSKLPNLSKEEWAALINLKTEMTSSSKLKHLFSAKASTSFPYPRKATNSLPDKCSDEGLTLETSAF